MDLKQILPLIEPMLPLVEPILPGMMEGISQFLPEWMNDTAKKHKVEKLVIIMDTVTNGDKTVAVVKFMSPVDGQLKPLKKEDGTPYVEPASKLLSDLVKMGLDQIKKEREKED